MLMPTWEWRPRCLVYRASKSTCSKLKGWVVPALMFPLSNRRWLEEAAEAGEEHLGERAPQDIDDRITGLKDFFGADVQGGSDLQRVGLVLAEARQHGEAFVSE